MLEEKRKSTMGDQASSLAPELSRFENGIKYDKYAFLNLYDRI